MNPLYAHFSYGRYSCKVQDNVTAAEVISATQWAVEEAQRNNPDAVEYVLSVLDVTDQSIASQIVHRSISLPVSQHSLLFGERRLAGGLALQVISLEAQSRGGTEYIVVLVNNSEENPL
mmetsp:Transcript_7170/g.22946  ORF Transcript_7170/g.22946 Transcript_7170/m.22946 type:complete len:119 (-) Transcript_7170:1444-1800(-)